jgi:transposase
MSMGRVHHRQADLFVAAADLRSPGNPFYERLNAALDRHDFDAKVEKLCAPYYADDKEGRPSIPPGRYFRMVMIGYFENLGSERGIAWRCADSFSLKAFLGLGAADTTPTHSALSRIRSRLGREAFDAFHVLVLGILKTEGLVKGELLALDSTTMAANASMASIVRKDTRETYGEFVGRLAEAAGEVVQGKEDLARFDRKREDRSSSNQDWKSPVDPEARIARMKDGTTKMAYKAEHVVDAETNAIVTSVLHAADRSDHATAPATVAEADAHLKAVGLTTVGATVIADKGYCSEEFLAGCATAAIKTCVAVPKLKGRRRWKGKAKDVRRACAANLRRVRSAYGRGLTRRRGATVEKSFQNVFDRGGQRRTHLRGHENNEKRNLIAVAAHNLGVLMRKLIGKACPRAFAAAAWDLSGLLATSRRPLGVMATVVRRFDWRRRSGIRQPIAHSCGRRVA